MTIIDFYGLFLLLELDMISDLQCIIIIFIFSNALYLSHSLLFHNTKY